jgi:magnesium transporter
VSGGVRARLFDADGHDRSVDLADIDLTAIGQRRLVWVDVDLAAGGTLEALREPLGLTPDDLRAIEGERGAPHLTYAEGRLHLSMESLEPRDPADEASSLVRREVDLMAAAGLVVTVHEGPIAALDRFAEKVSGETSLGLLDAGDLLSSLVDEVIGGYYQIAEALERDIDRLDQAALRAGRGTDILASIVSLRGRIGFIRRTLAPHRSALAAMARPELQIEGTVGALWPGLSDRLEGALSAIEAVREGLLGTYDIHMGRSAQRANDTMKALTLLSAALLPSVVLAGIMGMNFKLPLFEQSNNFFVVLGLMVAFVVVLLGVARWRGWL